MNELSNIGLQRKVNGPELHHFVRVEFSRFKAFSSFTLVLRHFNILVGPNNAGKSTVLAAFRILAAAIRRANTRSAQIVRGPHGNTYGHMVDLRTVSVAEENIFYNYDDSEPAIVTFTLSNKNKLILYFPEQGSCYLIADSDGQSVRAPKTFKSHFRCPIGFVPILGPVEHNENLFEKEAARLALFSYRAARNFRNIWYHYPEKFPAFRSALIQTWPGMDIERPQVDTTDKKPRLHMFCPEDRERSSGPDLDFRSGVKCLRTSFNQTRPPYFSSTSQTSIYTQIFKGSC